ncbi:MAG: transporter associated domain-containing protein [Pseudomonadota bacterium]|nr:transporter associated domain-containing protein [Pseudomonadota bacterium]
MKNVLKKFFIQQWFYNTSGFKDLISFAHSRNVFDKDTNRMLHGVVDISSIKVRDIMIHRAQMNVIPFNSKMKDVINIIKETNHSRYPVLGENSNDVLGILLVKDLIGHNFAEKQNHANKIHDSLNHLIRPPMLTPEGKRIDNLLHDFQVKRTHMSMVINEYGEISGLVTIEDIFEEIVGEIEDEHDADDEDNTVIKVISPNCYHVSGLTPIDSFNDFFSTKLSDEQFQTIAGIMTQRLGRIPKENECFDFNKFNVKVLSSDNRRLKKVEITLKND